jgi:hypothetical protein
MIECKKIKLNSKLTPKTDHGNKESSKKRERTGNGSRWTIKVRMKGTGPMSDAESIKRIAPFYLNQSMLNA